MRLLSLAPSNTEILYALGLGDQIIGVTAFCDYPEDAKSKPKVGGWVTPLTEKIKQLSPDLIFTSYFLPTELVDWKGPGKIVHVAAKTLHEVYESILEIGTKVQRYKEAKEIVKKMKQEFAQIKATSSRLASARSNNKPYFSTKPKGRVEKIKVYMEEWHKPPMVSGNWVPELVEIAGGIEGLVKQGQMSREFSFEELQAFGPDLMIFHWCGFAEKFNRKLVIERDGWMSLDAVKNNRLFVIDDALLNRPGPRLVEGARKIQEILASLI